MLVDGLSAGLRALSFVALFQATGAAIYLASRAGDYVVGATIAVDGGIVYANPGIKGSGWDS